MLSRAFTSIVWMAFLVCGASCAASKAEIHTARNASYQSDLATVFEHTRVAVVKLYPKLQADPRTGVIQTAWHLVESTGSRPGDSKAVTRSAGKQVYVRFRIQVAGASPYQVRVESEASERSAGLPPSTLKKAEEPGWLRGRTDALQLAIHRRLEAYAVGGGEPMQSRHEPSPRKETSGSKSSSVQRQRATVHVRATRPGISVAVRTDGEVESVCVAPCAFRIVPGDHEVMIEGHGIPTSRKLHLQPGGSTYLLAKPRSEALATGGAILALAGLTGILVGTGAMALTDLDLSWTAGIAIGGVAGLGLGLGLSAMSDSSLEVESSLPKATKAAKAISLSGSF